MKKLLSVLLIFLILLSNVSCDKEADPTVPPETSVTTEAPLPPVDPLLEEYAFVLTEDFLNSYNGFIFEDYYSFSDIVNSIATQTTNFIPPDDFIVEFFANSDVLIMTANHEYTRYAYCTKKDIIDNVSYSVRLSFDHTKSAVDINDFEVKELVDQPNENLRQCPDQQTGYYVLEDTIYYYYENGNLQFIRWVYADIQMTWEVLADTEGYGMHSYRYTYFVDKSLVLFEWNHIMSDSGLNAQS